LFERACFALHPQVCATAHSRQKALASGGPCLDAFSQQQPPALRITEVEGFRCRISAASRLGARTRPQQLPPISDQHHLPFPKLLTTSVLCSPSRTLHQLDLNCSFAIRRLATLLRVRMPSRRGCGRLLFGTLFFLSRVPSMACLRLFTLPPFPSLRTDSPTYQVALDQHRQCLRGACWLVGSRQPSSPA
jgi:hypothetical protein